ncbi:MAG: creatininase family protein [Planctomycetes bacterium]|nr:creatininase family protein [Planctomycetota bacterium]
MLELAKLTWIEAKAALDARTIVFLPIGCTEPHGPHLPLDTDVTIALAQARRAAEKLERVGARCVLAPPLSYGLTMYTDGFAGRLTLRPGTLWALLEDLVSALEQNGVRRIVFSNAHLEPAHVKILRGVAGDHAVASHDRALVLFPDVTRRRFAERLGDEFRSGDCHAGRYETSIVLAADPGAVKEAARRELAPVRIDLIDKMKRGVDSFLDAGATDAYCGDPAAASAGEGAELVDTLADLMFEAIRETWPDDKP